MRPFAPCSSDGLSRRVVLQRTTAAAALLGLGRPQDHAAAQDATPEVTFVMEPNVSYGQVEGQELLLDVYRPTDDNATHPAVLLFHPGE